MKLLDILKGPGKGGSFPEGPKRVPYPNPHPSGEDGGCFPDAPKPPKVPFPKGPKRHPHKTPAPNRRGG
jgi:hypothetical protein